MPTPRFTRIRYLLFVWTLICLGFYLSFPPIRVIGVASNPLVLPSSPPKHLVEGRLELGRAGIRGWHLRGDDCITRIWINGKVTHQGDCKPCGNCDRRFFPFPPGLSSGQHSFAIELENLVDQAYVEWVLPEHLGFEAVALWVFGILLLLLGNRWGLRRSITAIFLVAMIVSALYVNRTGHKERAYDGWAHADNIKHILRHGSLPRVDASWESYQPPLYYVVASGWSRLFGALYPSGKLEAGLQHLAWLAFLGTLIVSAFCWVELERRQKRPLPWIGAVFIAGLPAHVFLAGRVSNDVFLPGLGALALAGALAYQGWNHRRWLVLASVAGALAIATKLSGLSVVLFAPLAVYLAQGVILPDRKTIGRVALVSILPAAVLVAWQITSLVQTHQLFYDRLWNLDENLRIPNSAYRWLSFDLWSYLSSPAADSREGPIRLSFWTFLVTSALQGEFRVIPDRLTLLTFMRAAFLPILAALPIAGILGRERVWKKKEWILIGGPFGVAMILLLLYCAKGSFSCNQDFRFLAPVFVPLGLLISLATEELSRSRAWRLLLQGCSILFALLLLSYYYRLTVG